MLSAAIYRNIQIEQLIVVVVVSILIDQMMVDNFVPFVMSLKTFPTFHVYRWPNHIFCRCIRYHNYVQNLS